MRLSSHQTRKNIKHKTKAFFKSAIVDAPRNAFKNQVQLFAVRWKIVDAGSVATMFVLNPNESDLPRSLIPGSIRTLCNGRLAGTALLSLLMCA
jgi:hypothetical protein